jgi:hypothetical protein
MAKGYTASAADKRLRVPFSDGRLATGLLLASPLFQSSLIRGSRWSSISFCPSCRTAGVSRKYSLRDFRERSRNAR